jgi:type III pantothenate kinase
MRTLAINVGNSRIACAIVESGVVLERYDHSTLAVAIFDVGLKSFTLTPDRILIASVVPNAVSKVRQAASIQFAPIVPEIVSHGRVPMRSEYQSPASLGIDRLLGAYAARELYAKQQKNALIIVDLGTATTFNCVSEEGVFLGGVITLGLIATFEAIGDRAAQLPSESLQIPSKIMAASTSDAIRSGVFFSSILSIRGILKLLIDEVFSGNAPKVIYTGGASSLLSEFLKKSGPIDTDLVLKGIAMLPSEEAGTTSK